MRGITGYGCKRLVEEKEVHRFCKVSMDALIKILKLGLKNVKFWTKQRDWTIP